MPPPTFCPGTTATLGCTTEWKQKCRFSETTFFSDIRVKWTCFGAFGGLGAIAQTKISTYIATHCRWGRSAAIGLWSPTPPGPSAAVPRPCRVRVPVTKTGDRCPLGVLGYWSTNKFWLWSVSFFDVPIHRNSETPAKRTSEIVDIITDTSRNFWTPK